MRWMLPELRHLAPAPGLDEHATKFFESGRSAWPERPLRFGMEEIFCESSPWGDHYGRLEGVFASLHAMVSRGDAILARVALPDRAHGDFQRRLFTGNSEEHKELCGIVATWMASHGSHPASEPSYGGGTADVGDVAAGIFAECGYTSSFKVIAALRASQRILVVPYPDELRVNTPLGFLFTPIRQTGRTRWSHLFGLDAAGRGLLDDD